MKHTDPKKDGIADYYDSKRREAEAASDALARYLFDTPTNEKDPKVMRALRDRLERARFVGD